MNANTPWFIPLIVSTIGAIAVIIAAFANHHLAKKREDEKVARECEDTRAKLLTCLSAHVETLSRITDLTEPSSWQEALNGVRECVSKANHVSLVLGKANHGDFNALLNQEQRAIEEHKKHRPSRRLITMGQSAEDKKRRDDELERYAKFSLNNVATIRAAYDPFVSIVTLNPKGPTM